MGKKKLRTSAQKSAHKSLRKGAQAAAPLAPLKKASRRLPIIGSFIKRSNKASHRADDMNHMAIEEMPVMLQESPQRAYDAYIMNLSGTLFKGDLLMPGVDKFPVT